MVDSGWSIVIHGISIIITNTSEARTKSQERESGVNGTKLIQLTMDTNIYFSCHV